MPIFEYKCEDCGTGFERLVRNEAEERDSKCPSCGGSRAGKRFSTFAFAVKGPSAAAPCGERVAPGACGMNPAACAACN